MLDLLVSQGGESVVTSLSIIFCSFLSLSSSMFSSNFSAFAGRN